MKEIEIIKYEAFDGTVFENEDECLEYERNHVETHFYGFKCYDRHGVRLTTKEHSDILDWSFFINIEETNNFEDFLEYYDNEIGLNCCYEDYGISNFTAGHYYYDEDNDKIVQVEAEIARWQAELENFPNN